MPNTNPINITQTFDKDRIGRVLKVKHQINGGRTVTVSETDYTELGQVKTQKLHKKTSGSYVQELNFKYNIKGWLTYINDPSSLGNDFFAAKLEYNTGQEAQYSGNISSMSWISDKSRTLKKYEYTYDKLDRLSGAEFSEQGSSKNFSVSGISYDLSGNLLSLHRKGKRNDGTWGDIDLLSYSYANSGKSNKLFNVADDSSQESGFSDGGSNTGEEYFYDANGNMTEDLNKDIKITYNKMNLPLTITKDGTRDVVSYLYTVAGQKVRRTKAGGSTDYVGNFIYENKVLKFILFAGGRIVPEEAEDYEYQYYLKDHLGNNRSMFTETGKVLQEDSYYPFGMTMDGLEYVAPELLANGDAKNKMLYNGKEIQEQTGFYDYGFRQYDPTIGRWHVTDALAERFYSESPYNYVNNNPINKYDILGLTSAKPIKDHNGNVVTTSQQWNEGTMQYETVVGGYGTSGGGSVSNMFSHTYYGTDGNNNAVWGPASMKLGTMASMKDGTNYRLTHTLYKGKWVKKQGGKKRASVAVDRVLENGMTGGPTGGSEVYAQNEISLINNSNYTVWFKPDKPIKIDGKEYLQKEAYKLLPGEGTKVPIDGFKVNGSVFKVTDGYNQVVILTDGSFDTAYDSYFESIYYFIKGGEVFRDSIDKNWYALFDAED